MIEGDVMLSELDLKRDIKNGCTKAAYLLYGDDSYLIKNYSDKISEKVTETGGDFDIIKFDNDIEISDITDALLQFSFLNGRKCIVASNIAVDDMSAENFSKLKELIKNYNYDNVLVLTFDSNVIEVKRSSRLKTLISLFENNSFAVVNIAHKTKSELSSMLIKGAEKRGVLLSKQTADFLVDYCSDEINILVNELEKLCSYKQSGEITKEDIFSVCSQSFESSIYNISKYILLKDANNALLLLRRLIDQKVPIPAIYNEICSCFLDIFYCKCAEIARKKDSDILQDFEIPSNRAFRIKNAKNSARRIELYSLKNIISTALEFDAAIKGNNAETEIEIMVINIISCL